MSQKFPKRIAITLGDPAGIGPEITAKALAEASLPQGIVPVVYGSEKVWSLGCKVAGVPDLLERIEVLPPPHLPDPGGAPISARPDSFSSQGAAVSQGKAWLKLCPGVDETLASQGRVELGKATEAGGFAQLRFLEAAAADLVSGKVEGLVTAPVNKAAIMRTGLDFVGHTEFLQEKFGVPKVVMLMAGPRLKVALATTHLALSQVPQALSVESLLEVLRITHASLKKHFGAFEPRLAVLGLNPHAGEDGKFGDEELRIVEPALKAAREQGIQALGPFAADGYFAHWERQEHDGVVALYHDQGLIPFKMLDGATGVNVTLGLPRPRTSPDHGVAYDIAGQGVADQRSMAAALNLCARMVVQGG